MLSRFSLVFSKRPRKRRPEEASNCPDLLFLALLGLPWFFAFRGFAFSSSFFPSFPRILGVLGGRFGYLLFFLLGGWGRGSPGRQGGGGSVFYCKSQGGVSPGPRGREGVCGELGNWGG